LVIDYVSGVMAAVIEKKLSSSVGLKGLMKKFAMVLIVVLAHQLDQYAGTHLIQSGVIMFFIVNELISITENYGRIGLPLPPQIKNVIAMLREKK
jgi:toxin secretion/phage lysis holin